MKTKSESGQYLIRDKESVRWLLVLIDALTLLPLSALFLVFVGDCGPLQASIASAVIFTVMTAFRFLFKCYVQIWRYGGIQSYMRMLAADTSAAASVLAIRLLLCLIPGFEIGFNAAQAAAAVAVCCLFSLAIRMYYRFAYKCGGRKGALGNFLRFTLRIFAGRKIYREVEQISVDVESLHRVAIIGAGQTGVSLAEELMNATRPQAVPVLIAALSPEQTGREIYGIPVVSIESATPDALREIGVGEVVFCIPESGTDERISLFNYYRGAGISVKVFDYPLLGVEYGGEKKKYIREFDVEELLFRTPVSCLDAESDDSFRGKTILITGGGGSIGSELCRQLSVLHPARIVVLDVYENGAYDLKTELNGKFGDSLDVCVEILSVCNMPALERVFDKYRPDIVLHAAAHKHVPLMEHNCVEAVDNNVFGTLNVVLCAEKYGAEKFLMVSTDKAVNPTNVMGATKRVCEMIVMSHAAAGGKTSFCATRFGNVLGSAGSVIPLFKRQIASGGPVTVTDKRIIRYFMTIPEASQLVLKCAGMAKNGELFVLDMGKPVRIIDLAENLIRLSGFTPYVDINIVETGLRPGEKLYEELLIASETLSKTENRQIFIERDAPVSGEKLEEMMTLLREAVATGDDENVKQTLRRVVPTFRTPEEVNSDSDAQRLAKAARPSV